MTTTEAPFYDLGGKYLAVSYQPDADAGTGLFSSMTGKKMALLVVIIIIGGFASSTSPLKILI